jgi:hypothetical protein
LARTMATSRVDLHRNVNTFRDARTCPLPALWSQNSIRSPSSNRRGVPAGRPRAAGQPLPPASPRPRSARAVSASNGVGAPQNAPGRAVSPGPVHVRSSSSVRCREVPLIPRALREPGQPAPTAGLYVTGGYGSNSTAGPTDGQAARAHARIGADVLGPPGLKTPSAFETAIAVP